MLLKLLNTFQILSLHFSNTMDQIQPHVSAAILTLPSLAPKAGFGPVLTIQVSLNEKDMTQISDKTNKWKIPSLVAIVT